jgi:hypothetical protein
MSQKIPLLHPKKIPFKFPLLKLCNSINFFQTKLIKYIFGPKTKPSKFPLLHSVFFKIILVVGTTEYDIISIVFIQITPKKIYKEYKEMFHF